VLVSGKELFILIILHFIFIVQQSLTIKSFFYYIRVDVFIPNISQIGGFSMCSPPLLMEQSHQIHLAVKKSSWPPAEWVHSSCKAGDKVQIRVGGDFYYDPPSNSQIPDLVFIAGGVGINPLLSIMLHLKTLFQTPNNEDNLPKRITLLHCAKQIEELLFQVKIDIIIVLELKPEIRNSLT
jgi:ferredoxin-NADP reductase